MRCAIIRLTTGLFANSPTGAANARLSNIRLPSLFYSQSTTVYIRRMTVRPILLMQVLNSTTNWTKSIDAQHHLVHSSSTKSYKIQKIFRSFALMLRNVSKSTSFWQYENVHDWWECAVGHLGNNILLSCDCGFGETHIRIQVQSHSVSYLFAILYGDLLRYCLCAISLCSSKCERQRRRKWVWFFYLPLAALTTRMATV